VNDKGDVEESIQTLGISTTKQKNVIFLTVLIVPRKGGGTRKSKKGSWRGGLHCGGNKNREAKYEKEE